jgi:hypothetical protein
MLVRVASRIVLTALAGSLCAGHLFGQTFRSQPENELVQLELRLNSDGTYAFANSAQNCFGWFHETGTWRNAGRSIILRSVSPRFVHVDLKSQSGDQSATLVISVADPNGNPLPGVAISEGASLTVTRTDSDGKSSLRRERSKPAGKPDYVSLVLKAATWEGHVTVSGAYSEFALTVVPAIAGEVRERRLRREGEHITSEDFKGFTLVLVAR